MPDHRKPQNLSHFYEGSIDAEYTDLSRRRRRDRLKILISIAISAAMIAILAYWSFS